MPDSDQLSPDELWRLFTNAPNEAECAKYAAIFTEILVIPLAEEVLRGKRKSAFNLGFAVSREDFEDLRGECGRAATIWLKKVRAENKEVQDFRAYLARVFQNVWNDFLRRRAPQRERLRNEIRYTLGKFARFKVWHGKDDKPCAGLSKFGANVAEISGEKLIELIKTNFPPYFTADLAALLDEIFAAAKGGLLIDDLILTVAELWNIRDFPTAALSSATENKLPEKESENVEMRFELKQVWQQIQALPVNQRTALLYNLRDKKGREMLFQFFNLQIASLAEIAAAMNLSRAEFAAILPLLPLPDKEIALKMNLSEKQISNLRKVAREKLVRQLSVNSEQLSKESE